MGAIVVLRGPSEVVGASRASTRTLARNTVVSPPLVSRDKLGVFQTARSRFHLQECALAWSMHSSSIRHRFEASCKRVCCSVAKKDLTASTLPIASLLHRTAFRHRSDRDTTCAHRGGRRRQHRPRTTVAARRRRAATVIPRSHRSPQQTLSRCQKANTCPQPKSLVFERVSPTQARDNTQPCPTSPESR